MYSLYIKASPTREGIHRPVSELRIFRIKTNILVKATKREREREREREEESVSKLHPNVRSVILTNSFGKATLFV